MRYSVFLPAANAAKEVKGTVPKLPPLQPPPPGFKVDSTNFYNSPPAEQTAEPQAAGQNQQQTEAAASSSGQAHGKRVIWPYFVFVAIVIAGYGTYKYFQSEQS